MQTLTALLTTPGQNLLGGAPGLPNEVSILEVFNLNSLLLYSAHLTLFLPHM